MTPSADWAKWLPEDIPQPNDGIFELGLVLGGTVSAGAYTAGVIDFLIEALDAWDAARGNDSTPSWRTRIQAIAGTSGGGVIAALLGRTLSFQFPPVRRASSDADGQQNPLYRIWVRELDIAGMLDLGDLSGKPLASVLNPAPLEKGRSLIEQYQRNFAPATPRLRDYLPEPLPVILTLTNLRGIPYRLDMGSGNFQRYVDHADYVRLGVFTRGGQTPLRPDEYGVSSNPGSQGFLGWGDYAEFALGTSAFPLGFPLRSLHKPMDHYRYRPIVSPAGISGKYPVQPAPIDWDSLKELGVLPNTYTFLAADGGMTDNEPIELCRRTISGWIGHNPRSGLDAKRAILLVDPFAERPEPGPQAPGRLNSALGALITTWKEQARYDSRDLMLAADDDCFSRFMITAQRAGVEPGSRSIATASAGAFGGFLCEAFRRHDFLLGRANCQDYLRKKLVLPIGNPLFKDWKAQATAAQLAAWVVDDNGRPSLPIVPLCGLCRNDEQTDAYPFRAFNVHARSFQEALKERIEAVLDHLKDDAEPGGLAGLFTSLYLSIGELFAKGALQSKVTDYLEQSLKDWKLL